MFLSAITVSVAFINKRTESKPEYALLSVGHFGLGMNEVNVIYENGVKEDLVKKLNLKTKGDWNTQANFPEEVKAIKYLNQQGYTLLSHSCDNHAGNAAFSYIFVKGN